MKKIDQDELRKVMWPIYVSNKKASLPMNTEII